MSTNIITIKRLKTLLYVFYQISKNKTNIHWNSINLSYETYIDVWSSDMIINFFLLKINFK